MSTSSRSARARRSSSGPSKTDVLTSRRGPATGGSNGVRLTQVDRVEPFDPGAEVPAAAESRRAPGLARVGEASFDLVFENIRDVDLERRLLSGEAPGFLRLVRRARFGIRERIA